MRSRLLRNWLVASWLEMWWCLFLESKSCSCYLSYFLNKLHSKLISSRCLLVRHCSSYSVLIFNFHISSGTLFFYSHKFDTSMNPYSTPKNVIHQRLAADRALRRPSKLLVHIYLCASKPRFDIFQKNIEGDESLFVLSIDNLLCIFPKGIGFISGVLYSYL